MSELLFYNGHILTMNPEQEKPSALLVRDHQIIDIGSYEQLKYSLKESKNEFNLNGRVLMPAMIDAHTHFYENAKFSKMINLSQAKSMLDIKEILIAYQRGLKKPEKWIRGWGWDKNKYHDAPLMNKEFLDQVFPNTPVTLDSHDLHSKWCNSKALEIAHITKSTLNPEGGEIGKDQHGEPNGLLFELAWALINSYIPDYNYEEKKQMIIQTTNECYQYGLSGVNVMEGEDRFKLFKDIVDSGMKFRFFWHFPSGILDDVIERKKNNQFYADNDFARVLGMKVFMDGSLGSQTALMYDPYPDNHHNYGRTSMSFEDLYQLMLRAGKHDIPSTVHSIGDKCNHELIKLFVRLNHELGRILPHRIEHLQAIRYEDLDLLKASQVSCAMQAIHMKEDIGYIDNLWGKASQYSYLFNQLDKQSILFALSSDAPVETINPFEGIYSAIERRFKNNPENKPWHPEECINIYTALSAYTRNSAIISGIGDKTGTLEIGKYADLIVLDNFFEQDNTFWLTAKSLFTMIHGEVVYCSI